MKRFFAALLCAGVLIRAAQASVPHQKYAALTFDDGPSGALTDRLLDALAARGARATFFVCAYRVRSYPAQTARIAEEGHELGLHSCCHDDMRAMTKEQALDDLTECMVAVSECCGVRARLFRPPGGLSSDAVRAAAEELGLSMILWSVDPLDWDPREHGRVLGRILEGAADGAMILMHELSEHSVQCAAEAVDRLQKAGYVFVTVSELAARAGTELLPGGVFRAFCPAAVDERRRLQ